MIRSFFDTASEDIFDNTLSKRARRRLPQAVGPIAARKFAMLDVAESVNDLLQPPGNQLEKLYGDREGQYSIRINRQYRICFEWTEDGPARVEVVDYH